MGNKEVNKYIKVYTCELNLDHLSCFRMLCVSVRRISGHGNSIHNIIHLFKKEKCTWYVLIDFLVSQLYLALNKPIYISLNIL